MRTKDDHSGGEERQQALAWLMEANRSPGSPPTWSDIQALLAQWPGDAELTLRAVEALLRAAARRPRDEPALGEGPAHHALALLDRVQTADGEQWSELRAKALARLPTDRDEEAQGAFRAALAAHPEDESLRAEAARFHAWRGRFTEAFDTLKADTGREAMTLAATYATALGLGDEAARRWQKLGLNATVHPRSAMPEVTDMPDAHVRVPARGPSPLGLGDLPVGAAAFEILSVAALSPAHGVVQSASVLDAVIDYGDVVLWEPTPVAVTGEARTPCFPLLEILRRGDELRLRVLAVARSAQDFHRVVAALGGSARVVWHLERAVGTGQQIGVGKLLLTPAADLPAVVAMLEELRGESLALACPALYERAAPTERAGKEHKAWAALERKAERLLTSDDANHTTSS